MDAFLGMITPVGFNYAPRGWAICNGQLMSIAQNSALFSLLGTMYGGDGVTTFALPDLRGRVPVGQGNGPGLVAISQGQLAGTNNVAFTASGSASVTLAAANLPAHTHGGSGLTGATSVSVSTGGGGSVMPSANSMLTSTSLGVPTAAAIYAASASNPVSLGGVTTTVGGTTASTGSGTTLVAPVSVSSPPISIMPPYLGVNFVIALQGIYPSRN